VLGAVGHPQKEFSKQEEIAPRRADQKERRERKETGGGEKAAHVRVCGIMMRYEAWAEFVWPLPNSKCQYIYIYI
jgi:hypothetical protein